MSRCFVNCLLHKREALLLLQYVFANRWVPVPKWCRPGVRVPVWRMGEWGLGTENWVAPRWLLSPELLGGVHKFYQCPLNWTEHLWVMLSILSYVKVKMTQYLELNPLYGETPMAENNEHLTKWLVVPFQSHCGCRGAWTLWFPGPLWFLWLVASCNCRAVC